MQGGENKLARTTYKGLVPPDDPLFNEGLTFFAVKAAVDDKQPDVDPLKKMEMSWVNLYPSFYVNCIKSELGMDLEKEIGIELFASNYSSLDDDDRIEIAMACMSVLVEVSPTVSEISHSDGKLFEAPVVVRGVKNCLFFGYNGKNYGPFDSIIDAQAGIEKILGCRDHSV